MDLDYIVQQILLLEKENDEATNSVTEKCSFISDYSLKFTLLHDFVACGKEKVVQYLVNRGCNVDAQDSSGTTPLMLAANRDLRVIIKILLEAGADMLILNNENQSALHTFLREEFFCPELEELFFPKLCERFSTDEEIAQCLINAGCRLYQACCFKNPKIVKYMLEYGFSVDYTHLTTGQSALHIAVSKEDIDTVKLLLCRGANINAKDCQGATPLSYVYYFGLKHTIEKVELLKIFLNLESSPLSCDSYGLFQITPTLTDGNDEAIRAVLQSNINFTVKDKATESSVLHVLATNKNPGVVKELEPYANKFDINALDEYGMSPLHVAVAHANVDMVEFLLDQGVNPNCVQNIYVPIPLLYAYEKFRPDMESKLIQCIELLLQYNADPQFIVNKWNNERTTVFVAAKKTNSYNLLMPVIAHLTLLEELGLPITKVTLTEINSDWSLKNYFDRCKKVIRKEISGSLTLFKLLTANEKQIARYLCNEELMLKLTGLTYKYRLKSSYSYYYSILRRKLSKGVQRNELVHEITEILCKVSGGRINKMHQLIIDKITDFLDNKTLLHFYRLSNEINM